MFALIETNNATHIAIHVPSDKATESLASIARMLEANATFIRCNYRDSEVITPKMSITLGNTFRLPDSDGEALLIAASDEVIGAEFVADSAEVYRSNQDYRKKTTDELTKQRREIDALKLQNEQLKEALAAATAITEGDDA